MRPTLLHLTISSLLATPVFAQANNTDTPTLPAIAVSGQLDSTPELNELLNRQGNSESGALLRNFSGVDGQRLGGHGLDMIIRGQGQSAVNVLIDGGKIEGGCPNRMDPPTAYTELSSFDRIEIIKGIKSLQYGVGGTGGTVILHRDRPEFAPGQSIMGEAFIGTASNGVRENYGAEVTAGNDQVYIRLQGSYKDAENYRDGNGDEVRSSYRTTQGHIDLGWNPTANQHIKLSHEIANTADALFQGAGMDSPKSDGTMTRLSYEADELAGLVNSIEISVYRSEVDHVMNNFSLRPNSGMRMEVPSEVTTQGGKLRLTSNLGQTSVDYGVLLQTIEKQATLFNRVDNQSQFLMWPNTSTEQNSLFIEANTALSSTQNLIYGVRVDRVQANARDANTAPDNNEAVAGSTREPVNLYNAAYQNYSSNTKIEETNWNGLVRYEQTLSSTLAWFGGLSLTTRTADETERFMARADWTGNPDLNPERHAQVDLGLSHTSSALNWSVNVYYDRVSDYILRDQAKNQDSANARPVMVDGVTDTTGINNIYVNIDAEIYGAEFDLSYLVNSRWLVGGHLAFTEGRNLTDGRNLSHMAPLNGQLFAEYLLNQGYAGLRANFATQQSQVNTDFNERETPAWSTLDFYAGYQINATFSLQAGVDNLFDKAYFNHINRNDPTTGATLDKINEPGRSVWAKLNARF
ncbi:TonB-denpendent receptor [Thiomicrospira aerophila AL3]|uniref:TonB-denpendent receptor n=1 Tax=Thiomicrospira aerophila AL3 TaxID=717772 RepID=W0DVS8_9GAMM|nr:TonB-dependent receptor [Thiomicrospira aerophila]AHF00986.1 TonB-denpendent receptor [Thiomicrospira aerophila AL3]